MSERETSIQFAAAGQSSRMRGELDKLGLGSGYPKHLLPTGGPGGETLLGRVLRQSLALQPGRPPVINISPENSRHFASHPDIPKETVLNVERGSNFFVPFLRELNSRRTRVACGSGDHYLGEGFTWQDMVDTHEQQGYPITFLAARSIPVKDGLVYKITDAGRIDSFERVARTSPEDPINIGLYIFDPERDVLKIARSVMSRPGINHEDLVQEFLNEGLIGAHVTNAAAFNVNNPATYQALLEHTSALSSTE